MRGGESCDKAVHFVPLFFRRIDELHAIVERPGMRDPHWQFHGEVLIGKDNRSAGIGAEGLADFKLHPLCTDLQAASLLRRLLEVQPDRKIDGKPWRPIVKFAHKCPFLAGKTTGPVSVLIGTFRQNILSLKVLIHKNF